MVWTFAGDSMMGTYKSNLHTCKGEGSGLMALCWGGEWEARTHVPEIPIQDLDITMDDLQRREFVVPR